MNDQAENKTEKEAENAELIAAQETVVEQAAEAVTAAEANVPSKEDAAKARAELKAAKENAKQANAYLKSLGERTEENGEAFDTGTESATGWNAEVERLTTVVDGMKESKAAASQVLKEAKAALRDAKKALTALGKPAKASATKVERVAQNGILFPLEGSKAHIAWGLIEAAKNENNGETPTAAQVKEQVDSYNASGPAEELKASRVQSAFRKWRKFHGIAVGAPVATPTPAPAPATGGENDSGAAEVPAPSEG